MNKPSIHLGSRSSIKQFFRYVLVGIASNIIGYTLYLFLTYFGCSPKMTMSFLYGIGAGVGFYGNRKLTFSHKGNLFSSGTRYLIAHLAGYFINLSILSIFVDKLGYTHQYVQALAILIVAAFLFLTFKFFVFRTSKPSSKRST